MGRKICPFCGERVHHDKPFTNGFDHKKDCYLYGIQITFESMQELEPKWNQRVPDWHKWPDEKPETRDFLMCAWFCGKQWNVEPLRLINNIWLDVNGDALVSNIEVYWQPKPEIPKEL